MPHNNYLYQTRDIAFQMKEWLDMDKLLSCEGYAGVYEADDLDFFMETNAKICKDVICPANAEADEVGFKFVGGEEKAVVSPDSFKTVYNTVIEAGLGPQFGDRQSEGRMPLAWYAPILEQQSGASAGLVMMWCITQGATTVIQFEAAEKFKQMYLPKMYAGEWGGSMCLTEPGAGSEVGAVATKCFPTDTPGLYKIKGNKIFITSGDHDCVSNVVHLVLAKTPDAQPGTRGISCLMVPKFWVNDDGSMGAWNDVTTVGIEHKMGIHGSATCSLAFGENDNCYGWMIGEEPVDGRGNGMAQMFRMMNEERLNTGLFSLGVIGAAYYAALDYCKTRKQSPHVNDPKGPSVRIIEHADVRRMLMYQRATLEAGRALLYSTYYNVDLSHEASDPEERQAAEDVFMIQNPLCKAYISDMAWKATAECIQCYGGYGFIEEYPGAQLARDSKIYTLWEGTNFIQSNDLVGRKFTMNGGEPFKKWVAAIEDFLINKKDAELAAPFEMLTNAFNAYKELLAIIADWKANKKEMVGLFSTRVLHATAMVFCGKLLLDQALLAKAKLAEIAEDHFDVNFYKGKIKTATFYVMNIVPEVFATVTAAKGADDSAIAIDEDAFM